jgi:hypothetical protein
MPSMTFSDRTLTLLALIATGLAVLATLFAIFGGRARRPRVPEGPIPMDETLRALLEGHADRLERLEQAARMLHSNDKRQTARIDGSVRRVALLRYDAFEDVGGRLSFSCAMLDDHGTGVVLTSINGRQETRVYAKPVVGAASTYNLSLEEEEAIRQAMADAEEAVKVK